MWNPGFAFEDSQPAHVKGFHRSLCLLSYMYRGTPENPGLVLGLDEGGTCQGVAFRIPPQNVKSTIAYLDEREQVSNTYKPITVETVLKDGQTVKALTYAVRQDHEQYVKLPIAKQAVLVAKGIGPRGTALDYLSSTLDHLGTLGIEEVELTEVLRLAQSL